MQSERNFRAWEVIETFFLLSLSIFIFIWGFYYQIHTSEFWPIHVSDQFWNPNFRETIWIKPIFHFLLKSVFLLPLSDVGHLYFVKGIFALNAVTQAILLYAIFKWFCRCFERPDWWGVVGILLLISNPFYMNFAFRVRSDLMATSLLLFFIYFRILKAAIPQKYDLVFMVLFPMIGLKHFFFSFAVLVFSASQINGFRSVLSRHQILLLSSVTATVWIVYFGWNSIVYYISTLGSYQKNLTYLTLWFKNDFLLLLFGFLPFFLMRSSRKNCTSSSFGSSYKAISGFRYFHFVFFICFLLVSQKFSFFIASLIPFFYLSSFVGIMFILPKSTSSKLSRPANPIDFNFNPIQRQTPYVFIMLSAISIAYGTLCLYNFVNYFPYASNSRQLEFVRKLSPILHENKLSILDGVGIFPRVPNWKCFYSPDDDRATAYCRDLIENIRAPVIILSGRLLNLISGSAEIEKHGYRSVGAGVFFRSDTLTELSDIHNLAIDPAPITFGLEL